MQEQKKLSKIFQKTPSRWGLRGDPYLWQEMSEKLGDLTYPDTEAKLAAILEQAYEQLTGAPIAERNNLFIKRYSHGGMSSGFVSSQFWTEEAIPLLKKRYRETK